jgi:Arc/MetJ-type ribon-helix-helix transcriptional regulator
MSDLNLSHDSESFIQKQLSLGLYRDRNDVIEEGVGLLRKRDALIARLTESRRQLDEGEYEEYNDDSLRQLFVELIARAEGQPRQQ